MLSIINVFVLSLYFEIGKPSGIRQKECHFMKKHIFRYILFLFICLSISMLSVDLADARREASMLLEIPQIHNPINVIMKDIAASATRFYLLYVGLDPEKKVNSYIAKVYVFDHEGTRRPDEEFEIDSRGDPYGIAVTSKLVYISYFSSSVINAYGFDGTRLHQEDILYAYGGNDSNIAATETHFFTANLGTYSSIKIHKFQDTQGDEKGKRVSFVRSCQITTTDAEGGRPFVAATDTRVYIQNPYDPTIYVYDAQDGGRRAREDFSNGLWSGITGLTNVPSSIVSGITTTPLGGKLFLLMSRSRSDGKRGYEPVVYRYSIPEESAERPVIDLPAKPPATASYYLHIPSSGSGVAATDTNVYVAAGSGRGGLYGRIYSRKHSDGVPGSLYADSGKQPKNFSLYDHNLYSEAMTADYHNLYILRKHYTIGRGSTHTEGLRSPYSVLYCSLNSEASVPNGRTKLIDLELPLGMENFGRGIGLAIDSKGILYVMDSGENRSGAPRIYRYEPSLSYPPNSRPLPGNPITLHPNHRYPCGMTIVKNRAYVLDSGFNVDKGRPDTVAQIFVYALDGPDVFEYLPEESFELNVGPIHPEESGIAINGDTFFISMRPVGASFGRVVYVYGPPAAPSWWGISADIVQYRQPYWQDIRFVSYKATGEADSDKFQAIADIPWILSVGYDSDLLFGYPEPTIAFAEGYRKPEWLTLKEGVLSGTPPSEGKFTVELTATNEYGSADQSFTVNVAPAPVAADWLDFSVPEARVHDAWSLSVKDYVTGYPRPAIIFSTGYTPPDWLKLQNGVLSGTPTTGGIFPIQLTAFTPLNRPEYRSWVDRVIHLVVKGETSSNWALDTTNATAQGITTTDNRVYVTDLIDDKIYAYGHNGERYTTEDVSIKAFTGNPIGITATAANIYIVDNNADNVAILDANEMVSVGNFQLHPDNQAPTGIAATTKRLYVVDNEDDKIYAYAHDGTHHSTEDVNLHGHHEPIGITATSTRLYVVDSDTNKIYVYGYDGKLQNREVVELVSENRSPTGIAATLSHLFVVDILDQKVYSYPIPGTVRTTTIVGAPSWDSVLIPEAEKGSYWTFSLAEFVKGDPAPQINFTEGYTPPNWLTLQNGVLSGTPTRADVENIQVTATNSKSSADLTFMLNVRFPEVPSWDLYPGDQTVRSITATTTHVYVFYGIPGYVPHISAYTHDGTRRPDKDIKLGKEHIKDSQHIGVEVTATENRLFMLELSDSSRKSDPTYRRKVYVFDLTGTGSNGTFSLGQDGGARATTITSTATRFYAILWIDRKVYVYGHDGTPYPNENFEINIDDQNLYFFDMAATETRLYILFSENAVRHKVCVFGHDGTPYPNENFGFGQIRAWYLTVTPTHLMTYTSPQYNEKNTGRIHLYPLPNTQGTSGTVVHQQDIMLACDMNQDGRVDIRDLIELAQYIGETDKSDPRVDVNGDGAVDVKDLLIVSQYLGESTETAAPFKTRTDRFPTLVKATMDGNVITELIQVWIDMARIADDGSLAFKRGIANLERLLAEMLPDKTELLANYPNPFNPETWIPYHLAKSAEVQITIYDINGSVVRQLDLGQKTAGNYTAKSQAAHWDGRNADGEKVASGIYFYQLRAGDYEHTRRMLIVK